MLAKRRDGGGRGGKGGRLVTRGQHAMQRAIGDSRNAYIHATRFLGSDDNPGSGVQWPLGVVPWELC